MDKNVVRVLSNSVVVSSFKFGKLTASKHTEIIANATGNPNLFNDTFGTLTNKKRIVDRLLGGEDVSVELEFNEISLTGEELTALKMVRPIIEKIRGSQFNGYQFVNPNTAEQKRIDGIKIPMSGSGSVYNAAGHQIGCKPLKEIWNKASVWWQGAKTPRNTYVSAGGYSRREVVFATATEGGSGFSDDRYIKIGCQNVSRAELEYVAQALGWEPAVIDE
jgi:hypothetical protein